MVIILNLAFISDPMTEVNILDPLFVPDRPITYSIIAAIYGEKWIFVRHYDRTTWEIAGGHIEPGETSYAAAGRELREETGALTFSLECVATYSVIKDDYRGYGRLYLAEVSEMGEVTDTSEIAEVLLSDHLPEDLTYPDIQPVLFKRCIDFLMNRR
jgi:8-oxo-dGTP diphosphatase